MPAIGKSPSNMSAADVTQQCVPAWDSFVTDMLRHVSKEVKAESRRGGQRCCMGLMSIGSKDKLWLQSPSGDGGLTRKDYTVKQMEKGLADLGLPTHEVNELVIVSPRGIGNFKHYTAVVSWGPVGNAAAGESGPARKAQTQEGNVNIQAETLAGACDRTVSRGRRPASAPASRTSTAPVQHIATRGLAERDAALESRLTALERSTHLLPQRSDAQSLGAAMERSAATTSSQVRRPASAPSSRENISTRAVLGRSQSMVDMTKSKIADTTQANPGRPLEEVQSVTLLPQANHQRHVPAGPKPAVQQTQAKAKRISSVPMHSAYRANARRRPGRPPHSSVGRRTGSTSTVKDQVDEVLTKSSQAPTSQAKSRSTHVDNQRSFEASLRSSLEASGRGQTVKGKKAHAATAGGKLHHKSVIGGLSNFSSSASTLSGFRQVSGQVRG